MSLLDYAFEYLLGDEGRVFTNNPKDRGGPTKFGVTLKTYQNYCGHPVGVSDIESLTEADAKAFYRERFWAPLRCEDMDSGAVAVCIFDSGVLYGVGTVTKMVQLAVSRCGATIKFDGVMGDNTIAVLNLVRAEDFLKAFHGLLLERIEHIVKISPEESVFYRGWTRRADRLLALISDPNVNQREIV